MVFLKHASLHAQTLGIVGYIKETEGGFEGEVRH